ncbi:MAG: alpha/beta hydrolase [Gammaproteobacteria bacterium]
MKTARLHLDVSRWVDLPGPLHTAASVHYEPAALGPDPLVVFAFPGGGYGRGYFDIRRPELDGPTQAAFHCARGCVFVACDHLGVGESSLPDPAVITFAHLAAANHGTVVAVLEALAAGTVAPDLPRIADPFVIGVGHSMGGCIGVVQQARHRTFRALAVLGYSGARMNMREPPPGRDQLAWLFHWDETPKALIDADMADSSLPWRSASMPDCVPPMAGSGLIVAEAATIDVPLFVGAGERDTIDDLYTEPDAYRAATDITLFRLMRSAHLHNFAPTRARLWARLHTWFDTVRHP